MFRSLKASIGAAAVAVLVVLSMSAPGLAGGDEARQSAPADQMSLASESVASADDMSLPADALVSESDAEVFASRGVCSHSCEPCFLTCPDFFGLPQSCMRQCF